jgi:hypothetical protein
MVNVLVAGENTTHVGQQRMDEKESMGGREGSQGEAGLM